MGDLKQPLEIGAIIYRYASPHVLKYTVIERHEGVGGFYQYVLECQSCRHGENCRTIAAFDDYGKLRNVRMLSDDEYDPQACWHSSDTEFFDNEYEPRVSGYRSYVAKYKEEIQKLETRLQNKRKSLQELENGLDALMEQKNRAKEPRHD